MIIHLTDKAVSELQPDPNKRYDAIDNKLPRFMVIVRPTGIKSFAYKYISPITGKTKSFTIGKFGLLSTAQARNVAKQKAAEIALGRDPQLEKQHVAKIKQLNEMQTLGAFYHEHYKEHLSIRKNAKKLTKHLEVTFIKPWGEMPMASINKDLLIKWRIKRIQAGVKPSTINRDIAPLRALLNEAYKMNILETHPLANFQKLKEDTQGIVRYFEADEENRFLQALIDREDKNRVARTQHNQWLIERHHPPLPEFSGAFTDYLQPICLLALHTGMRRAEILLLQWQHINLLQDYLTVKSANAKSDKHRHIQLNKTAKTTLKKWQKCAPSSEYVFINEKNGKPFKSINTSWKSIMKAANINNFRFHDLRHNFASQLVMKGVDLYTVKELLGHSSIEITQKYAHLSPDQKAKAVALLV